jgi:hypothetical protein
MMALARASADTYCSYTAARAHLELASCEVMASTSRSKPRCHAYAATLSDSIVSLSMVAHSWRHWCLSVRPSSSQRKTRWT